MYVTAFGRFNSQYIPNSNNQIEYYTMGDM